MKIAVAQTRPIKGDIQRNIECHVRLVNLAVTNGADVIIFPELSLTGYEPSLAGALATKIDDGRFNVFQDLSDRNGINIGVGVPIRNESGVCISVLVFRPREPRWSYSKMFLHPDEDAFFVPGKRVSGLIGEDNGIALAVCYELSVPEHAAAAAKSGAHTYVASVAKSTGGIGKALERLAGIAHEYSMTVLMANSVGVSDGLQCAGRSSVWNRKGELLAQMNGEDEGIVVHDTVTQETAVVQLAGKR